LSSCATAPTSTVKRVKDMVPSPPPEEESKSSDEEVLLRNLETKLRRLNYNALVATNTFIDAQWEMKADPTLQLVVLTVKKDGFPTFLEGILQSHKNLRKVPREKSALVVLESEKNPGVFNIFIVVPAEYMREGDSITDWMPDMATWVKYVDLEANLLADRPPEEAFLSLFWMVNKVKNPELINVVESNNWDWRKMPNPKDTEIKIMCIPIGTLNQITKELVK